MSILLLNLKLVTFQIILQMVRISAAIYRRVVLACDARARRPARGGAQLARGDGGSTCGAHAERTQRGAAAGTSRHGRRE